MATVARQKIEWRFPRHGKFDPRKGGVSNYAFNLNIDTFVREVVQNINDQRLSSDKPARAKFILEDVTGAKLNSLLDLIGWDAGLRDHLEGVARGSSHQQQMAIKALDSVKSGTVRVVTIVDSDTNGLTGGETSANGNFAMLCRHELITDEDSKAVRGGAFGIGKSVLWAFSSASAVFFNSKPKQNEDNSSRERFIGRAYFPTHEVGVGKSATTFKQDGLFGFMIEEDGDEGTVSVKNAAAVEHVGDSSLSRKGIGTGTSIMVPFFEKPEDNEALSLDELGKQIRESIAKWFWPAIDRKALKASVVVRKRGVEREDEVELAKWVSYFQRAANSPDEIKLITEENNAGRIKIELSIPERVVKEKHSEFKGELELCLSRISEDESPDLETEELINTVAFIRGALMVVQYSSALPNSLPDFVGVLNVGRAISNSEDNKRVDSFFRDAEPPAHNKWTQTAKIKTNYKGTNGQKALQSLNTALGEAAKKLLGATFLGGEKIPKKLAELLAGRRKGKKKGERSETFHTNIAYLKWVNDEKVAAKAELKRMKGEKAWTAKISLVLRSESGKKEELDHKIEDFKISPSNVVVSLLPEKTDSVLGENWTPGVSISVPEGVVSVNFELSAVATRLGKETVKRSRANLSVQFNPKDGERNA